MPTGTRRKSARFVGAAGRLAWAVFPLARTLAGCTSTPCVGEACPDACNGIACDRDLAPDASPGNPVAPGLGGSCSSDSDCDEASGFACVEGICRHGCRSHFDCGGVAICEPLGRSGTYCAPTTPSVEPGRYYSSCPTGECDRARGFLCVGAGLGDTESFCSSECTDDRACPTGFYCDAVASDAGTAERKLCVPRSFCAECERDTDCLATPGGVCALDASGERRCTTLCDPNRNSCPWGPATECRLTDERLGVPTCQHRFGACRGEGFGCEPCVRDDDCPRGYCLVSTYSGERWCIDQELPCSCAGLPAGDDFCRGANGCPQSPSLDFMVCYDPGSPGEGICVGVNLPSATIGPTQLSCWR